jgi:hypothetical protein
MSVKKRMAYRKRIDGVSALLTALAALGRQAPPTPTPSYSLYVMGGRGNGPGLARRL